MCVQSAPVDCAPNKLPINWKMSIIIYESTIYGYVYLIHTRISRILRVHCIRALTHVKQRRRKKSARNKSHQTNTSRWPNLNGPQQTMDGCHAGSPITFFATAAHIISIRIRANQTSFNLGNGISHRFRFRLRQAAQKPLTIVALIFILVELNRLEGEKQEVANEWAIIQAMIVFEWLRGDRPVHSRRTLISHHGLSTMWSIIIISLWLLFQL